MEPQAVPTTPAAAVPGPAARPWRERVPESTALIVFLLILCVFFAVSSPYFLAWDNFLNIFTAMAVTGIIAAPATLLLVAGQFDLSVGAGAAFVGAVAAYFAARSGLSVAVPLAVGAGLLVGLLNGFLVTVVGINALITTLGTLAIFRGLTQIVVGGQSLPIDGFSELGTGRPFLDIPMPVLLFLLVAVGFGVTMRYTTYGRRMYAIGSNAIAARLAGVRLKRSIFLGFVLSGLGMGLGGLILVSQLGAASPTAAAGLELSVITAVILGGASLAGGRGTIIGTVLGLFIIGVLNNGLVLLNVSSFWQEVARGTLLILAVAFDRLRVRVTGATA
jgi:ribose transport system permease protein